MRADKRKKRGILAIEKPVASEYPLTDDVFCIEVLVPAHWRYLALLQGFMAQMTNYWSWVGTDEERKSRAALCEAAYVRTDWEGCMECTELTECLQPLFDALETQISSLSSQVTNLQQIIDNSTTVLPPKPYTLETCTYGHIYSGALLAVEQVNLLITSIYKRAEVEAPDNLAEGTELLLSAVPFFETLPFDELFSLAQWAFDNQKATYEADYVVDIDGHTWFERAAGVLWCLAKDTCTINHETIGMWLSSLDELFPDNYAAEVFTRFGDATTPTMINQIGEALDSLRGGQSLAEFFDDIIVQFGVGAQNTNPDYTWIECPTYCDAFDFRLSDFEPVWGIRMDGITPLGQYVGGVGYAPVEAGTGNFQSQIYLASGGLSCASVQIVYTCPEVPEQAQLAWVTPDYSVYVPFASLALASGTHTEVVDLTLYTPEPGATGIGLVSGNSVGDIDNVVTWQQANFS